MCPARLRPGFNPQCPRDGENQPGKGCSSQPRVRSWCPVKHPQLFGRWRDGFSSFSSFSSVFVVPCIFPDPDQILIKGSKQVMDGPSGGFSERELPRVLPRTQNPPLVWGNTSLELPEGSHPSFGGQEEIHTSLHLNHKFLSFPSAFPAGG